MLTRNSTVPRRWADARRKLNREGCCRVCGSSERLEVAHVIGRSRDAILTGPNGGEYIYVHPDSTVPLCSEHHRAYDARKLDLLPYLFLPEQIRSVEDAGGLLSALKRMSGPEGAIV